MALTDVSNEAYGAKRLVILQQNAEKEKQILNELTKSYKQAIDERLKEEQKQKARLEDIQQSGSSDEIARAKETLKSIQQARYKAEEDYAAAQVAEREKAAKLAQKYELESYKSLNVKQKFEYQQTLKQNLKDQQKSLKEKHKLVQDQLNAETDETKQEALRQELDKIKIDEQVTKNHLKEVSKRSAALGMLPQNKKASLEARKKESEENISSAVQGKRSVKERLKNDAEMIAAEKKLQAAKKSGNKEEIENAKRYLANVEARKKADLGYSEEISEANKEILKSTFNEIGAGLEEKVGAATKKLFSDAADSIDGNLEAMFGQQGRMMGRLQGSAIDWAKTVDSVSDTIGFSGIVSKKSVVSKMVELVDSGVAYNLEMRAFLAETSQNIASTFDATNGTLLRLIRLQQADTTNARLGMEATLTKLFNDYFQDTSYLAQDVSASISDAILDANATMSRDDSLEFEYIVQKWLGSLYSLGMSSDAVSNIAQGLSYLATGNVSALNSNSSLQTLFAMSASRSGGKSYSDLLTGNLTAEDTNKLLRSMIEYLAEIADSQTNYVTKSAYADLFGMSITDLRAFGSLTTEEINSLYNSTVSYNSLVEETQRQMNEIANRMNLSTLISNVVDNALVGAATTIGSNAFTYGTWKALNILQDNVGSIKIPSVLAAGFGLSSDIDLLNVAKTGMVGMGLLGSLLGAIGSMNSGGASNLASWAFEETTQRGGGLSLLNASSASGTSYSALIGVGSASASDAQMASLTSAKDTAYENSGVSSEEVQEGQDIPQDIYNALAGETPSVLSILRDINDRLAPERVFYTAIAGVLSKSSASQAIALSNQIASASISPSAQQNTDTSTTLDISSSTQSGLSSTDTNFLEPILRDAIAGALDYYFSTKSLTGVPVSVVNTVNF